MFHWSRNEAMDDCIWWCMYFFQAGFFHTAQEMVNHSNIQKRSSHAMAYGEVKYFFYIPW